MNNVYWKAAKLIAEGKEDFCCHAIKYEDGKGDEAHQFTLMFKEQDRLAWMSLTEDENISNYYDRTRHRRVMALLFMHWMTTNP